MEGGSGTPRAPVPDLRLPRQPRPPPRCCASSSRGCGSGGSLSMCLLLCTTSFACFMLLLVAGRVPSGVLVAGEPPWRAGTPGFDPGETECASLHSRRKGTAAIYSSFAFGGSNRGEEDSSLTHHVVAGQAASSGISGGVEGASRWSSSCREVCALGRRKAERREFRQVQT